MAFRSFVILGAMRTGSNLLEESLNAVPGITCHGEIFNPAFVGYPNGLPPFGLTQDARDDDPFAVLSQLSEAPGLNGFRLFPGHDGRVLTAVLADPTCAKIILGRNPVESYVSLSIARQTDQWKLGDARNRRTARIRFDEAAFMQHLDGLVAFRRLARDALQASGQAAFHLDYADLRRPEVIAGLVHFLGVAEAAVPTARRLVPQNPEPLADKVTNPRAMAAALARTDPFGMSHLPDFEPRRGPAVPSFVGSDGAGLLFMPVEGGPTAQIRTWLQTFGPLRRSFNQSTLRDWMRGTRGHLRFTVLRHPLLRAYAAYESLLDGSGDDPARQTILRRYGIARSGAPEPGRDGFAAFLRFLKANLSGQTAFRTEPGWASQSAVLQGFQSFAPPDLIAREDRLPADLGWLCATRDMPCPDLPDRDAGLARRLTAIRDAEIDKLVRQASARDFLNFGFDDWGGTRPQ